MKLPTLPRLPVLAQRVIPIVVPIVILALGLRWFVVPMIATSVSASNDVRPLEERAASLRRQLQNPGPVGDTSMSVAEFQQLVSPEDRVPQVMERLAKLALDPPNVEQARSLSIEAGAWTPLVADLTQAQAPGVAGAVEAGPVDPRWALFPGGLQYALVTMTFETTYDRLGSFFWQLRDMPTLVEVRYLEVARALPLLKVKIGLAVLRRTPMAAAQAAQQDKAQMAPRAAGAPPATNPVLVPNRPKGSRVIRGGAAR